MNWDYVEGNWNQLACKVKAQWGKLTDNELNSIDGRREQLTGKIQQHYGLSREQAENDADLFARSLAKQAGYETD